MMISLDMLVEKYSIKTKGVLHCGASTGQEYEAYKRNGFKNIVWVEAIPSVYEQLAAAITERYKSSESFPLDYVCELPINACVSDVDGQEVDFHISNNEGQSSSFLPLGVHKEIHPQVDYVSSIKLKTTRLDTLFNIYYPYHHPDMDILGLLGVDFINFDLQGAELLALKGMGKYLENIKYAYLEVNKRETYVGCALVEEVDEYLKQYNLHRVETHTWVDDTWTDAFYVKK